MRLDHHEPRDEMSEVQRLAALHNRPRSFINLRAFASDSSEGIASATSPGGDRFLSSRRLVNLPPGPVTVGVITLTAGSGAIPVRPADEFLVVSEGAITFTQGECALTLTARSSAVIPHGSHFSWSTPGPVSIIFMRYSGGQGTDSNIVPIDDAPELKLSGTLAAELLLTPAPVCRNYTDYRSPDEQFTCGTWDSTPYHRTAMSYRHYELMQLLEGSVTFVDETGRGATFSCGDIFLVEQGAQCSWESREQVAKVYAIFRPA